MNQEEMYKYFGVTAEQIEQWSEEAENGGMEIEPGTLIQMHPITSEEQVAIDRVREYYHQQDEQATENGRELATAH
ncbi:MAG: hypothetical protein J6575_08250 [Bifidobacterium sp.]|nr:hypothetical protein [Bifidobacterium sp.]